MTKSNILLFTLVVLFGSTASWPAYAYLDPGTGAIILQLLVGGVAGALVIGKLYWQRLKGFFSRKKPAASPVDQEDK